MSLTPPERIFETFNVGLTRTAAGEYVPAGHRTCCNVMAGEYGVTIHFRIDKSGAPQLVVKHAEVLVARNATEETKLASYSQSLHFCPFCGAHVHFTEGTEEMLAELQAAFPKCGETLRRITKSNKTT